MYLIEYKKCVTVGNGNRAVVSHQIFWNGILKFIRTHTHVQKMKKEIEREERKEIDLKKHLLMEEIYSISCQLHIRKMYSSKFTLV